MSIGLNKLNISGNSFISKTQKNLRERAQDTSLYLTSSEFRKAKKHLRERKKEKEKLWDNKNQLNFFDIKKLEGIQKGIPLFEGVSMKNIKLIAENLQNFALTRGCHNKCTHCYVGAKPPIKETADTINTISFEDFNQFVDGFKKLNKRLKFNVFNGNKENLYFFYDSDPVKTKMMDKSGKAHNVAEAMNIFFEAFKKPFIFDTAGWAKGDNWSKKTAQDVVKFFQKTPEAQEQCNISINPFHSIMEKSYELKAKGNHQKAQKIKNLYIERMTDALKTLFVPLYNKDSNIINRYAHEMPVNTPYSKEGLDDLCLAVGNELYFHVEGHPLTMAKGHLSNKGIFKEAGEPIINISKTSKRFFSPASQAKYESDIKKAKSNIKKQTVPIGSNVIINPNGKVYLETDKNIIIPTDIQLNFENKNKKTAPFTNSID